jgi:hypothetical protein
LFWAINEALHSVGKQPPIETQGPLFQAITKLENAFCILEKENGLVVKYKWN